MRLIPLLLAVALVVGAVPSPVGARSSDTVYIAEGIPVASFSDALEGSEVRDYVYPGDKGQKLSVSLSSKSGEVFFRVLKPGGDTLYNSRKEGNYLNGIKLPRNGNYKIRVHLRDVGPGHVRHYSLTMRMK